MDNKLMWRRLKPVLLIVPVLAVTMFALWELVDSEQSLPTVAAVPLPGTPDLDLASAGERPLPIAPAIARTIDQALLAVMQDRARPPGESRLETSLVEQSRTAVVIVNGHGPTFLTDLPQLLGDEVQAASAPGSRGQGGSETGAISLATNPAPVSRAENAGGAGNGDGNGGANSGDKGGGTNGSGGNSGSGGGGNSGSGSSGNGNGGDDNCDSSGSGNPCNA